MFYLGEDETTPVAGLGALYQAPDGTVYQVQGLGEDEDLRGLSEEEISQSFGIGSYVGEVRQGLDGQLYEWVQTVDGLGNPIGFWKKIRRFAQTVAAPVVRAAAPIVSAAAAAARGAFRLLRKPWCIPLQPYRGPVRSIARRICPIVQHPAVRTLAPIVPHVGTVIQATRGLCKIARSCGLAGVEGNLMQAPDGTLYQVQGLAEEDELRGLGEDEELRGLGALYQAPDGSLYQGISEDEELRGISEEDDLRGLAEEDELRGLAEDDDLRGLDEDDELRGFAEDEELRGLDLDEDEDLRGFAEDDELRGVAEDDELKGLAEEEDLRGLAEDEEMRGVSEDEELRGLAEDEELRGLGQGYVRTPDVSGLEAYVPEAPADTRWFKAPVQPPDLWKPLW